MGGSRKEKGEIRIWRAKSSMHYTNSHQQARSEGQNCLHTMAWAKSPFYCGTPSSRQGEEGKKVKTSTKLVLDKQILDLKREDKRWKYWGYFGGSLSSKVEVQSLLLVGHRTPDPREDAFGLYGDGFDGEMASWSLDLNHLEFSIDCSGVVERVTSVLPGGKICKSACQAFSGGFSNGRVWVTAREGRFGDVNMAGVDFYNKLIDALLLKGIQPFVTLTHLDFPRELEERYEGWLSPESQKDFAYFAETCFKFFGDRVKYWVTINEPNIQVIHCYRTGNFPPSRCSKPFGNCLDGDSEKEPYIAAHNLILSHASAVDIYRTKFQKQQGGSIGIVLQAAWFEPISNSTADKSAAERAQSFFTNWLISFLPADWASISKMKYKDLCFGISKVDYLKVKFDAGYYVKDCISSPCKPAIGVTWTEGLYQQSSERNGVPIGESIPGTVDWMNVYPQGMEKVITYVQERYNNTPIFITENGYGCFDNPNSTIEEALHDIDRVKFMADSLDALMRAVRNGANVRGYFVWSLLDNFEWTYGNTDTCLAWGVTMDSIALK
ncbi:hypothetical protein TIFTF001_019010 [Ficus carica]|uniref:Uncharacterized protein n=1 Tax=Ficus carica TaxID=3494 RepID=A0AA88A865_FICCA|nr:hypothetical protein TIFTF001_019010 [Ficus carica]